MMKKCVRMCVPLLVLAMAAVPSFSQTVGIFDQQADWGPRGAVKVDGSASFSDGVYTLEGNGDDIWNADDEGFYLYTEASGSWSLSGEFTWLEPGGNDWAKLGPMIRVDGDSATSANYTALMRGAMDLISPQWREEDGIASGSHGPRVQDAEGNVVAPENSSIWLRITRLADAGNTVFIEWSRDGENWNYGHDRQLELPETVAYGIAITNHDDNEVLASGTASDVEFTQVENPVAIRSFASDFATEGSSNEVTLSIASPGEATLTEILPEGWSASNISNGGTASGNVITWDLTADVTEVSYSAEIPVGTENLAFSGDAGEYVTIGSSQFTVLREGLGIFESHADIGPVGLEGGIDDLNPGFIVQGSGADIWGTADEFHYLFTEITGAFTIKGTILVFPLDGEPTWTKGGIMLRDNLTQGSPNVFFNARSDSQVRWQVRGEQDASTSAGTFLTTEQQAGELEMVRVGDAVNLYYNDLTTGQRTLYDTVTVGMAETIFAGLAITSHDNSAISEVWAEDVEITEHPFMITRDISTNSVSVGDTIDLTISTIVRDGETADISIEENIPAGFNVVSSEATAGEVSEADGVLTWTLSGASGEATLTYSVSVDATASALSTISGTFDGGSGFSGPSGDHAIVVELLSDFGVFNDSQDVGDVDTPGFVAKDGDTWQVVGSGADIWATADEMHYLWQQVSGDFSIRVDNPYIGAFETSPSSNDWQKMGLMARQSLDAGSAYAYAMLRASDQAYMLQWRDEAGIDAAWEDGTQVTADIWNPAWTADAEGVNQPGLDVYTPGGSIELTREGDLFTAYFYDADGNQQFVMDHEIAMTDPLYVGVAVTSHEDGSLSQGRFDNPQIQATTVNVYDWTLY